MQWSNKIYVTTVSTGLSYKIYESFDVMFCVDNIYITYTILIFERGALTPSS